MADKDKDPRPAEEKAVSDAVDKAVDQHGPVVTVTMLERELAKVRKAHRSGDYPKTVYGPDGQSQTVESKAQEKDLGKGWSDKPDDAHRERQSASSGAVAETTERVQAEAALRRAAYLANPADSTAHSALHGAGVVNSTSTTTDVPGLLQPTLTASDVDADGKPLASKPGPTPQPPAADNPKATA